MTLSEFVARLEGAKGRGDQWDARCPGHDDRKASLRVTAKDGKILVHCLAGCDTATVIGALGVTLADLHTDTKPEAKGAEVRTEYAIRDAAGTTIATHIRIQQADGSKRFSWVRDGKAGLAGLKAADLPLYGSELLAAHPTSGVVLVEGEKAADALRAYQPLTLATACGASVTPSAAVLEPLRGRRVALWPDHDEPGRKHMAAVAAALAGVASEVRCIEWGSQLGDDAADMVAREADPRATLRELATRAKKAERPRSKLRYLHEAASEAVEALDRFQVGDMSRCVPTGIPGLDRKLYGGLARGTLILIGGPTGHGKTTLASRLAVGAAKVGPVLMVSPEMSAVELAEREIVRISRVSRADRAPWSRASQGDAAAAHAMASGRIASEELPIVMLDSPEATMDDVEKAAEELQRRHGSLALVLVDYAQQVADTDPRTPRYLTVGAVGSRGIEIARRFDCAVVVTSQVNVVQEGKAGKSYTFRETALLEQKCHVGMILVVEWGESNGGPRWVKRCTLKSTKGRNISAFELPLRYEPALFSIEDEDSQPSQREPL